MTNHHKIHQNQTEDLIIQPNQREDDVVVVMVPFPAQGHLNQLLQLSRLIIRYKIPVHYITTATHGRQVKLRVHGWDPLSAANIHFHEFKTPPFLSPPPDPCSKTKFPSHLQPCFGSTKKHLRRPVGSLLKSLALKSRKVIVIHDTMVSSVIQEVGLIPNAESYCFHSISAFTSLMYFWDSIKNTKNGYPILKNIDINIKIPSLDGCFTDEFSEYISSEYQYRKLDSGSIYNTSRVFEREFMEFLENEQKLKHWALGPFNPMNNDYSDKKDLKNSRKNSRRHFSLEWLDEQEPNSVIYVSFGTTTSMKEDEIKELAIGLIKSDQKFIWVLRDADKGDVFEKNEVRKIEIPNGFEDSIKGKGLIIRDWAPQLEILGHRATGGFLSHCGWNSCMESISAGVPIGAWPMHSDQPRNTVLITEILKIGIVVKEWRKGGGSGDQEEIVTSDLVEQGVRRLMKSEEGDEVRRRVADLGGKLRWSVAEGGCSRVEFDSFIAHITS